MKKNILLPTDFSKNSWNAIQYAIKLYGKEQCDFYILNTYTIDTHVIDTHTLLDPDHSFDRLAEKRSKTGLGDIMVRLTFENDNPLHHFYVLSRSTPFVATIKKLTDEIKIDLIVMGAKGMTDRSEGRYGKNTLSVIESIRDCPVLVVPKAATFQHPEEIVLATNFDSDFKVEQIKHLAEIARISGASIQVLSFEDHSLLSPKQIKNKMLLRKYLKHVDYRFNVLHNVKMATALSCFVKIRQSGMISYIDKKPSFWQLMGLGKRTLGQLGFYKDVPVLALHA
ncbi:universal stress protein [Pseudozobellia thermophila]|uniref:Nucleotide-binding universal stress protein, UspA family n=1 Tax=Pseudozobellia thermophila TaxID=192903 RepID=A0A1M6EG78_9FLAO|nr:universal stress protein [Pseudozobellia thermophila]SHI84474.1 Nucleotide-binding universal stress protein, UspA family [Pseudozobellia thermophila]